ncbi:MAG TPA: LamG domain-containing protein [Baekduia sp.]|nr:LamG domain-containing protein [Baekduia sp.]
MQGRVRHRGAAGAVLLLMLAAWLTTTPARAASSVVGQWRFDEAGGQRAIDDGPFGLDGRLGSTDGTDGADPVRIPGVSGGALRFDGSTLVRLPPATQLTPRTLTIESVVRAGASPGTYRYVVSHGAEGCIAGSYGLYTARDGGIAFYVFDGRSYQLSAAAAPADVWNGGWHHVAGVFDGLAVRLYLDGRAVGDPQPAPLAIAYGLTSSDSYFGSYQGTCALPLVGDLDLVRLWNGPLSADFVAGLSDAAATPPPTPAPSTDDQPAPETVPIAPESASNGGAPGSRPGLAPIAPGTSIPAGGTPGTTVSPASRPGAPAPACTVKPSVRRVRAGRVTAVTVRVAVRSKPVQRVRVRATYGAKRHQLAIARTASNGRARLRLKPHGRNRISVTVVGRQDCAPVALTVLSARRS